MDRLYIKLRNLDAYPKINEDFFRRTFSGGVITLASSIFILILFISEFRLYLHTVTNTKLVVDTSRGGKLRIDFDITFPAFPCSLLSLDAMDISGERHLDIRHDIFKKRLDSHGNVIEVRKDGIGAPQIEKPLQRHGGRLEHNETYCGSCYGAEMRSDIDFSLKKTDDEYNWCMLSWSDDECCNSCEEVREAYRKKGWGITNTDMIDQCKREGFVQKVHEEQGEGCSIHGSLEVNKVAGKFQFSPGKSFHIPGFHLFDFLNLPTENYNMSHKINKLMFGDSIPGIVNPLDGVRWVQETPNGMYQYFVKVVPTIYTSVRGHKIQSNQFSVTEHSKSSEVDNLRSLPGVFFYYDLSPIKVTFTEEHTPFLHFLTHICAIVGGIFTVAGIVDSFVYHGQKALRKKREIGKLG